MLENPNQKKHIKSGRDVRELKIKNKCIESRHNAKEPESKQRDLIWARCPRTRNKMKGSNPCTMLKNPKQKEGTESGHDAEEPESKQRDQTFPKAQRKGYALV